MSDIILQFRAQGLEEMASDTDKAAQNLNELAQAEKQVETQGKSLRSILMGMREELGRLALAGKENTAEYKKLRDEAGRLKDTIADVAEELATAGSDTSGLDKALRATNVLLGGFTAVQGAVALFGDESEDLQKTLLKVNAAMSILNGLQAIQGELAKKDSIITAGLNKVKQAYVYVTTQATIATKALTLAFSAGLIGVLVLLVTNWDKLTAAMNRNKKTVDDLKKSQDDLKVQQDKQVAQLGIYEKIWKATGKTEAEIYQLRIDQAKKFQQENSAEIAKTQRAINKMTDALGPLSKPQDYKAIKDLKASVELLQEANFALQGDIAGNEFALRELGKEKDKQDPKSEKELSTLEKLQKAYAETAAAITELLSKATVSGKPVDESTLGKLTDKAYELANQIAVINAEVDKLLTHGKQDATEPLLPIIVGTDPASKANVLQDFDEIQADIAQKIEAGKNEKERLDAERRRRERQEEIANASAIANSKLQIAGQLNTQLSAIISGAFANQQAELEEQRSKGLITEKQYQREVAKIKQRQARADKAAAITQTIINGAQAVTNALATVPFPAAFVVATLAGALATAQVAIIAKQKIPAFKGGVIDLQGPGTATSDSIHARLSKGESVMTARETYEHRPVLEAIRNKEFAKQYVPIADIAKFAKTRIPYQPIGGDRLMDSDKDYQALLRKVDELILEQRFGNQYFKQGNSNTAAAKGYLKDLTTTRRGIYT